MNTNPVTTYRDRHERHERLKKCLSCCKRFVAFFFSQIGLCCLVVSYSIMGGFIFRELEAENELSQKSTMLKTRQSHVDKLWNLTLEFNILYKPNWTLGASKILRDFQLDVYKAIKEKGWDGKDASQEIQWSFAGALLYSVTVITTIGYGHIAPKTAWGRFMTIVYAIFGIPMTLLCLANLGGVMANIFRFLYSRVCCGMCCICFKTRKKPKRHPSLNSSIRVGNRNGKPSLRRVPPSSLSVTSSKNSMRSTSQQSMAPPPSPANRHGEVLVNAGDLKPVAPHERLIEPVATTPLNAPAHVILHETDMEYGETDDEQDVKKKKGKGERVTVPISLCIALMAGYIFGGAVLFALWEEDWDYLIGSYFCFVTLSTIGFGDFVPGASMGSWSSQEKQVLCTMYLLFGLAFIAMCFELMQEEVRAKFRWLGTKMGIFTKQKE